MTRALALAAAAVAFTSLSTASWAAPDNKNRRVTVENISGQSINYLYASPITSKTWEEDLLGERGTIPAGTSKVANIDNGTTQCFYDLKVKFANGREFEKRNVNVCAVSKWIIGDSGNTIQ